MKALMMGGAGLIGSNIVGHLVSKGYDVVVMDIKRTGLSHRYEVVTHNGTYRTGLDPIKFAKHVEDIGAGEILVNSVDRDGEMKGYDIDLIDRVRDAVNLPLSLLGGAGFLSDIEALIRRYGIIGAAAGSLFVFKGKDRAVLINYPSRSEKDVLCSSVMNKGLK